MAPRATTKKPTRKPVRKVETPPGGRVGPDIVGRLEALADRLADALLKVPRAEDYEPLAEPLREFTRVAPALAEALAEALRTTRPLAEGARNPPDPPASSGAATPSAALQALETAAAKMADARASILEALGSLPRDPEYTRFAAQLRELAAVSPSLLEWLSEVPRLTLPLGDSVRGLEAAAQGLEEGRDRLLEALRDLDASGE